MTKAVKKKRSDVDIGRYLDDVLIDMDDDGIRCDICYTYDQSNDDQILMCDGCDVAVHQCCYNVKEVPQGDWYCRYCHHYRSNPNKTTNRVCILCPRTSGALMSTEDGSWVHTSCALWCPEVYIENLSIVRNVYKIQKERFESLCYVCKWHEGTVVQCSRQGCYVTFHPSCGRLVRCGLNVVGQIHTTATGSFWRAYCDKHRVDAYGDTENEDLPLEERQESDAHTMIMLANILRRNRTLTNEIREVQKENSPWGYRMSQLCIRELQTNLNQVRSMWSSAAGGVVLPHSGSHKVLDLLTRRKISEGD
eukprot:GHVR01020708.1.p1 GENE.GHVR01020708.1~~GHVR01020708.1.p1  ORF type:complete len:307 (+),score=48.46 GHVR01020708.1:82-1002(+)